LTDQQIEWFGEFSLRRIFRQARQLLLRNVIPFGAVALLMTALYELGMVVAASLLGVPVDSIMEFGTERVFNVLFPARGEAIDFFAVFVAAVGTPAFYYLTWQIATVAICRGTFENMAGRPGNFDRNLSFSLEILPGALGVIFAVMLQSTAAVASVWFTFVLLLAVGHLLGAGALVWSLFPVAFFASYFAWIAVILRDWVAVPVYVLEQGGIGESLRRSARLTEGRRGRILIINALVVLACGVVSNFTADFIGTALTTAFSAVLACIVYQRLRVEKEALMASDIRDLLDRPKREAPSHRGSPIPETARATSPMSRASSPMSAVSRLRRD
jgi:hypothetical protein